MGTMQGVGSLSRRVWLVAGIAGSILIMLAAAAGARAEAVGGVRVWPHTKSSRRWFSPVAPASASDPRAGPGNRWAGLEAAQLLGRPRRLRPTPDGVRLALLSQCRQKTPRRSSSVG